IPSVNALEELRSPGDQSISATGLKHHGERDSYERLPSLPHLRDSFSKRKMSSTRGTLNEVAPLRFANRVHQQDKQKSWQSDQQESRAPGSDGPENRQGQRRGPGESLNNHSAYKQSETRSQKHAHIEHTERDSK